MPLSQRQGENHVDLTEQKTAPKTAIGDQGRLSFPCSHPGSI